MLKTLALTLTLLLSFTMAACSSTSGTNAKIDQTTTNAAQTAPTDAVQRIRLTLANQDELIVKLNGTRAAEDFLSLLPLELTCKDFNNTEKVAYLPRRLDTQGAPAGFDRSACHTSSGSHEGLRFLRPHGYDSLSLLAYWQLPVP